MKPKKLLLVFIILYTGVFIFCLFKSLSLNFNGQLISLLPQKNKFLTTYKKLTRLNSSEGGFDAIITIKDGGNVITPAKNITGQILALTLNGHKVFKNADFKNDLHKFKYSALYMMTGDELDHLYSELKHYIDQKKMEANPYYVNLDDSEPELKMNTYNSVLLHKVAHAKEYSINRDSSTIRVTFYPQFSKSNYNKVKNTYALLLQRTGKLEHEYKSLKIYWGGEYVDQYNKINQIQHSVSKALTIGVLCLVLFMVGYLIYINRNISYKPVYIIFDLFLIFFIMVSGFIISLGISSFIFSEINVFTGIVFSILFGINLDYILHVYSISKEDFIHGTNVRKIISTYLSTTKPIILSCLTTGLAIASLIFAKFDGFIQFGIIFFINIAINLIATYIFLLLSPSKGNQPAGRFSADIIKNYLPSTLIARPVRIVGLVSILVFVAVGAVWGLRTLRFNFDFSDLEPKSNVTEFDTLRSEIATGSNYHEPSYFITDSIKDSRILFNQIRKGLGTKYTDIAQVESFSARYPVNRSMIERRAGKIDSLKSLVAKNEQYLKNAGSKSKEYIDIINHTVPPRMDNLPKYITNRFFFKNGKLAPLVVIYPKMSLSNGRTSIKFRKSSGTMILPSGKKFYAASTSIIASSILALLMNDSTFLFAVPMATIIILLLISYRSVIKTLIAISPLLLTFLILLTLNALFGFDINLYNVIVLPIIIGVGADNGIHIVDSLETNRSNFLEHFLGEKFQVLSACSFTTILGFLGLLFINHPGLESIGILAITSISAMLFSTFFYAVAVDTFLLKN